MQITLKAARVNAGLTQKEVSEYLDVTPETIRNWERGKSFPDVPQIKKLESKYGVEYKDIIFLEN